jgi:hypothetical protein
MQTKTFAIIAAVSLATSLSWTTIGNGQEQGSGVCQQSVRTLVGLTIEASKSGSFHTAAKLGSKDWQDLSLTEKRLFIRSLEMVVASQREALETMTLRRVNGCPQHDVERVWAEVTEKKVETYRTLLSRAQIRLALEQQ